MCESTVYSIDGTKIMEDVLNIKINGNNIELMDILNTKKDINGTIVEIDLDKHGIYIDLK
ncbi:MULTISPECIES: CooT family nickel-binding protein [Methanobacterium]|jgi:predicted RNA-binding protein|uniref:CooT family nickel-binding protein n=1 Tax=Methanobacterium spitsbergense TaxID=2874285 RepID=A0A8T5UUA2_9EURY|nr:MULTISPECIES: CooT family nickel-binding protein [Methanobacterium]MBZ2164780.1 CooT family nickel-binding protein [Methanobacterium spitsbergense]